MEPTVLNRGVGCGRIVVIPLHHDIAAYSDLTQRFAVMRYFVAVFVHHAQFSGTDQLDALARFDSRPLFDC